MTDAASRFRVLHQGEGIFVMPNPWDVGTARMLESLGFKALATASAALAINLGRADGVGQVSREEALDHARTIIDGVDVPINGDLETGFGDEPEAVAQTISDAIASGLAGCSIEDLSGDTLYDRDHALERIRAGVQARDAAGSDFVLTARCEAYLTDHANPLAESIDRLVAMAEAGADVVYACGMSARDDIAALVREVPVPVNVLGATGREPLSVAELQDLGVRRISMGPRMIHAALGGFLRAAEEIAEEGTFSFSSSSARSGKISKLMQRA